MTSRLDLYNGALFLCGERKLASLTENREPVRLLNDVWDRGAVKYMLEQGLWKFAKRVSKFTPEPAIVAEFGYAYAYEKPEDFVRVVAVSADPNFQTPLLGYSDEAGFWRSDANPLYVTYISNHANFGGDMSLWPQSFVEYFHAYLASKLVGRLTAASDRKKEIYEELKRTRTNSRGRDAMSESTKFFPQGGWVTSRRGGGGNRNDGGNTESLIG